MQNSPDNPANTGQAMGRFLPGGKKPLMAMVEVTNRCNMTCPMCFSDSSDKDPDPPLTDIRKSLENLLKVTETPIQVQISGGEPAMRQDLPQIIVMAKNMGYNFIELVTNGVKIANETGYLEALARQGLTGVFLQFDGLKKETHIRLRGRDLTRVRGQAIEAVRRAGICCVLASAVTRGVNDKEIGDIMRFALDNLDVVRAVHFQSARAFTGRFDLAGEYRPFSLAELLGLIHQQTGVSPTSFINPHLGNAACNATTLVYPVRGKIVSLFKYITNNDVARFLGDDPRQKMLDVFLGKKKFFAKHLANPAALRLLAKAAPILGANPLSVLKKQHLIVFAKSFMDCDDLSPQRIKECCYGIATPQGVYSFCAYNNLYRFGGGDEGKLGGEGERV